MKTLALALLLALYALTPSAHAEVSPWYVGENGANCLATCAGKGTCKADKLDEITDDPTMQSAVESTMFPSCFAVNNLQDTYPAAPYILVSNGASYCYRGMVGSVAATCDAFLLGKHRLCYCEPEVVAAAHPDAKLVLKNDYAGVMFGDNSDVSVRRLVEGDLHLKPAEGRSVMIEASMHIAGGLKLEIDAVSGEDCTSDERGLIRYVTVGSSDQLEVCAQKDDGSTVTIAWRSLLQQAVVP